MKQTLITCLLLGWFATAFSQTGVLRGTVSDAQSKTPLELATISVFREDSSLVTYQLSDKSGRFMFDKLPLRKKLLVSVSYTGYVANRSVIEPVAGKADTLNVMLDFDTKDSNAVVVTAVVPIKMNGDTLEINPAAFKLKQDAVVEEVLNQVSGITIWSDGTITVNGKRVQNLLVDGKPFMGSTDSRVATQNLPKAAIDKIQLYQEYDRSNISQASQPQDSLLTMNIKLKESSKKGYFGKVGFGYGTLKRFESDASFQVYNKQSSVGIGGGFNNINKTIGNLQEMFQNNTYRNYNPNLYNVGRFGTNGINKNHSLGAVFSHSFIETANSRQNNRIAVNYNKSGIDAFITDLTLQNRTAINNPQFVREEGVQNNQNDRHDLGINYVKTNSYNDNLSLNGAVNTSNDRGNTSRFTEVRDSANVLQSTNQSNTTQRRRNDGESVNMNFAKSDRDNPLKRFTLQLDGRRNNSNSEREVKSLFQSLVDASKNTSYNRFYTTNTKTLDLGGNLNYGGLKRLLFGRYNLFNIDLSFNQAFNYVQNTDDSRVTDFDSTSKKFIANNRLTYLNERKLLEYTPSLGVTKNVSKYTDKFYRSLLFRVTLYDEFKTDNNKSTIAQRNINRSFQFFRYDANVNYSYNRQRKYSSYSSFTYNKTFQYPSIDQLYTVVDDINVYDTRVGNPFLRNRINHTFRLNTNFNTEKPDAKYSYYGNLGSSFTRSVDPVVDSTINDVSGRRISYYVNADKSRNLSLNGSFNISRKFGKNSLQLMYDGQFSQGNTPNYIDRLYNISETENFTNNFRVQFSLRSLLVLNLSKTLQYYKTKQTAAGLNSFKNSSDNTRFGIVLNYPKNFTVSSTLDHLTNSNLLKPTILWNSFATYRFMKQQGELKFSAMDILKQYRNITNSVNSFGTTTRITNGLQQYYLLTFSYYPRKFGKTVIKRQAGRSDEY